MRSTTGGEPSPATPTSRGPDVLYVVLIAAGYFLAHGLAFLFPDTGEVIMAIWPAGGIGLAALLLFPRRLWPGFVLAFYIAGVSADVLLAGRSFFPSLGYKTANMVESLGCAALILSLGGSSSRFARVNEVLALIVGAVVINAGSACVGAASAHLSRGVTFGASWLSWYVSHGLGVLLIAPFLVAWSDLRPRLTHIRWSRLFEGLIFLTLWCGVAHWTFEAGTHFQAFAPRPYMLIGLLAWPAMRLGQRGVTLALVVLAVSAIAGSGLRTGPSPWGGETPTGRLLLLQVFLAFAGTTGFLWAAIREEARSAADVIRKSEQRFRTLFNSMKEGFALHEIICDENGKPIDYRFLEVNPAFEQATGVRRSRWLGRTVREVIPTIEDHWIQVYGIVALTGKPVHFERYVPELDRHCEVSAYCPEPGQFAVIVMDITEHKRAAAEIHKSRERLELAVHGGELGMWDWNPQTGAIVYNDFWAQMLGYRLDEVEPTVEFFKRHIHPEDLPAVLEQLDQHVAGHLPAYQSEHRLRTRTGEWKWVLDRGKVVERDANGRALRATGIVADISRRKQAEDAREALLAELGRSNAELEQFASLISHDLLSPVVTASTFTSLLAGDRDNQLSPNSQEALQHVQESLVRMHALVRRLLDYSRLGRGELRRSACALETIMDSVLRDLGARLTQTGAQVTRDALPTVNGDATLLAQVFQNLVENAVKYHGPETPRIHVSAAPAAGEWHLSVADNGIGIDPTHFDRLFHIFGRLHRDESSYPGLGVGLATCKRIVEKHGGRIWVESQPGQGSTFRIALPA